MATQSTEFGSKVALLGALTIMCAARPMIERVTTRAGDVETGEQTSLVPRSSRSTRPGPPHRGGRHGGGARARGRRHPPGTGPRRGRRRLPVVAADAVTGGPRRRRSAVPPGERRRRRTPSRDDLLQDLAVQEQALVEREVEVLPAFSDRAWRSHLEAQMRRAAKERSVTVDRFDISDVVVSVAMRRGQAAPAVLATVFGRRARAHLPRRPGGCDLRRRRGAARRSPTRCSGTPGATSSCPTSCPRAGPRRRRARVDLDAVLGALRPTRRPGRLASRRAHGAAGPGSGSQRAPCGSRRQFAAIRRRALLPALATVATGPAALLLAGRTFGGTGGRAAVALRLRFRHRRILRSRQPRPSHAREARSPRMPSSGSARMLRR